LPAWFDPDLLEKALGNLLSNALKFTPEAGTIQVSVHPREDQAYEIVVRDSGPGISSDELSSIFEPYKPRRSERTRGIPGTGLGLSMASRFLLLHGGRVEAESELGFGSIFRIVLPMGSAHLPPESLMDLREAPAEARVSGSASDALAWDAPFESLEPVPAPKPPLDPRGRPVLFILEDHAEVRDYLRRHLEGDYHVVELASGAEALKQLETIRPDLMISDVMMPEMDGLTFLKALRERDDEDPVPVIFLSARVALEDRLAGLRAGGADYLTKPFEMDELKLRIQRVVEERRAAAERRPVIHLHPSEVEVVSADLRFLAGVRSAIEASMGDSDFDVVQLAQAVGCSRSGLYRRLEALNAGSPADLLRTMRLERAAQLLAARKGSVSRIAHEVGFRSLSHFSRAFRAHYGTAPSEYAANPEGAVGQGGAGEG
jgi:DNA-binding response OmpR family regulator